jgi:hypothetical protein
MNWGVLWLSCWARPSGHQKTIIYVHVLLAFGPSTGMSSARYLTFSRESFEVTVSGGSTFARVKLKEIDGMAPQDVERAV